MTWPLLGRFNKGLKAHKFSNESVCLAHLVMQWENALKPNLPVFHHSIIFTPETFFCLTGAIFKASVLCSINVLYFHKVVTFPKTLTKTIWTDDPKTLCPGPDPYLHHDLKRLSALESPLALQFDRLRADGLRTDSSFFDRKGD